MPRPQKKGEIYWIGRLWGTLHGNHEVLPSRSSIIPFRHLNKVPARSFIIMNSAQDVITLLKEGPPLKDEVHNM